MKCESSITYCSKAMANVKVSADKQSDRWTDGQTEGPKKYMPPIYQCGGIKISNCDINRLYVLNHYINSFEEVYNPSLWKYIDFNFKMIH